MTFFRVAFVLREGKFIKFLPIVRWT